MRQKFPMSGGSLISRFMVILLIILILSILSITTLWYIDTRTQIESRFTLQQKHSEQILRQSVIWIDGGIRLYEYSFEPGMKEAMDMYLATYNESGGDITKIDLPSLKTHLNQTIGGTWDLYIIDAEGTVVHTTYTPDLLCRIGELDYSSPPFQERIVRFSPQYAQVLHYPLLWAQ